MNDADQRDVVDLVVRAVHPATADGRLELARQVGVGGVPEIRRRHLANDACGVKDLVGVDPGERAADDDAGAVTAGLGAVQPDLFQAAPDLRHVFDPDPVQLDVLPVRDVRDVPPELRRDGADNPQLVGRQLPAVDADAQHEEGRLQLLGVQDRRLAAGDALGPLCVQAVPPQPTPEVRPVDGVEPLLAVDVQHPLLDGQRVAVLFDLLVRVEGLSVAEAPLPLSALGGHGVSKRTGYGGSNKGCTGGGRCAQRTSPSSPVGNMQDSGRDRPHPRRAPACRPAARLERDLSGLGAPPAVLGVPNDSCADARP